MNNKRNNVLMISTIASTIGQFNVDNIKSLQSLGLTVHIAADFTDTRVWPQNKVQDFENEMEKIGVVCHQIDFSRSFLKIYSHYKSFKQVRNLLLENRYEFIHTHTPIASAIVRLAASKNDKVIYTAHGFHFYDGAPLKNWLIYYPIEKILSRCTDVLITINKEDFNRAKKRFHAKETMIIPGVGIELKNFAKRHDGMKIRNELGIETDDFLVVSVGELNSNKNHKIIVQAIAELNNKRVHYAIAGNGPLKEYLETLAKELKVKEQVHLLGFRKDVPEIYAGADVCAFPSIREGQGLAAVEGMASGLPLIVSDNRGTRDFVTPDNGITCKYNDLTAFTEGIRRLLNDDALRAHMSKMNIELSKGFDKKIVNNIMLETYKKMI